MFGFCFAIDEGYMYSRRSCWKKVWESSRRGTFSGLLILSLATGSMPRKADGSHSTILAAHQVRSKRRANVAPRYPASRVIMIHKGAGQLILATRVLDVAWIENRFLNVSRPQDLLENLDYLHLLRVSHLSSYSCKVGM